jgi:iron complex outermembrane receptor protein
MDKKKKAERRSSMKRKEKVKGVIRVLVLTLLLCGGTAGAEELAAAKGDDVFYLGEVVVEGKAETITQVSTVDTADRERLDLLEVKNVSDAIESLPGVAVSVGTKGERNFNIRGFNQRYVPVFWDGIPIYIPFDGYVDTGKLGTENISKVTVTKGISSVLYGFNTMGGVINIVTRKPQAPLEADYRVSFSEVNTIDLNLNLGARLDNFYFTAYGGWLDSDGFPISDKFEPNENEDGGTRDNSDIQRLIGSFKAGFMPADGHEYAVGINTTKSEYGLPPSTVSPRYWRFTEWDKTTYYFIGDSRITDNLTTNLRLYRDEYFNVLNSYDDPTYTTQNRRYAFLSTYDDYSNGASLVIRSTHIPRNHLSFSFHYKEDVHEEQDDVDAPWDRFEQDMFSYGLEDDIKITDNLAFVVGASYDIQDPQYANGGPVREKEESFNPQGGVRLTVLEDMDLHLSAGRKTRFPTLFELYSEQFGRAVPNQDLAEEKAMNYEAGLEKPLPWDSLVRFALFYSDVEDLIVRKQVAPNVTQYQNIGEAKFSGLEFSFASEYLENNVFELHYTYTDAKNDSPDRTSDYIEEVPEHMLYISDLYKFNDMVSVFAKLLWNSDRWEEDFDGNWLELGNFWTLDAKIILTPLDNLRVELGGKNLFDYDYELSQGFPREGRSFFLTVRGTF